MATAVLMPKAGISVESCIIGQWKKKPGEPVAIGDILLDYETDKATFECESTAEGVLLEIFCSEGEEVPVLTAICVVGQPGEDAASLRPSGTLAQPAAEGVALGNAARAGAAPASMPTPSPAPAAPASLATPGEKVKVSPRAVKSARNLGLNPADATPTGPYGRVLARDIEALDTARRTGAGIGGRILDGDAPTAISTEQSPPKSDGSGYADEKFSGIRRSIAKVMMDSLATGAQLTNHHSCDATQLLYYRHLLKEKGEALGLSGISIGDMVMFAVSRTLLRHPGLNAHLLNGDILRKFDGVHLGFAVDTPRGLMVPTIFNAHQKTLAQISREVKELAAAANAGNISPDLLRGATFTVSNLGALGVEMFTPILNPPQVAILGVCGVTARLRQADDGSAVAYQSIGLSLTYDHRAVDGAPASRFAKDLADCLAHFELLLAM